MEDLKHIKMNIGIEVFIQEMILVGVTKEEEVTIGEEVTKGEEVTLGEEVNKYKQKNLKEEEEEIKETKFSKIVMNQRMEVLIETCQKEEVLTKKTV